MSLNRKLFFALTVTLLQLNFMAAGSTEKPPRLLLPKALYGTPGVEMNIYFDNIVLTPNIKNYVFDVSCRYGRQDSRRWCLMPTANTPASFPLEINVLDDENKIVASGKSQVYISPKAAGAGKAITLLMVGDSLTDASYYPREVKNLMSDKNNAKLTMIGSHCGRGKAPAGGVAHEGRGGWSWQSFCQQWQKNKTDYRAKSPFLTLKSGKPVLDFKAYCDKYNSGNGPDIITVMLGTNDIYSATDDNIESRIDRVQVNADKLIAEFKKVNPEVKIGLALTPPPTASQDAFGANYKCGQTRWQFKRNQHRLVKRMIDKYHNKQNDNIFLIPVFVNIDTEYGFPTKSEAVSARNKTKVVRLCNGLHPNPSGYAQIADTFYGWLKHITK